MNDVVARSALPLVTEEGIEKIDRITAEFRKGPQRQVGTQHVIHGGIYSRTIRMAKGSMMTSALIKIATTLIISGHATVSTGDEAMTFQGYNVIPGSAGRKGVWYAHEDTDMTMLFPTSAKTVEEAEVEFTDEADDLLTRDDDQHSTTIITGE
jgi:hypothetical protein